MEILEKVAYLKGLAEGMGIDGKTKEGKLLHAVIDLLDDIALELQDIREEQSDLEDGLDAVSEDLSDVESILYGDEDDEEEEEDGEDEEDDEEVYETTCPNCQESILFDETILASGYVECPNCGERLEFDLDAGEEIGDGGEQLEFELDDIDPEGDDGDSE